MFDLISGSHTDSDDDDDDTLMTASVFNSPTESLQDLRSIPIAPYERLSYNSQHDSFHTAADDQEFERDAAVAAAAAATTPTAGSRHNSDDEEDSDDTLVDGVSIASSCNTYISEVSDSSDLLPPPFKNPNQCLFSWVFVSNEQGGDAYKCARDEFFFRPQPQHAELELIDFSELACDVPESAIVPHPEKTIHRYERAFN